MKKIIALILIITCLVTTMTGCDMLSELFLFDKTDELEAELPTGDKVEFLITKGSGYAMELNRSTRHYEVTDSSGTVILDFIFRNEKDLKSYIDSNNRFLSTYENGENSACVYSVCSHKENEEGTFVVIGWLIGTDTGFIATTPKLDRGEINKFLDNWSFNIMSTNQQNSGYYAAFVKIK